MGKGIRYGKNVDFARAALMIAVRNIMINYGEPVYNIGPEQEKQNMTPEQKKELGEMLAESVSLLLDPTSEVAADALGKLARSSSGYSEKNHNWNVRLEREMLLGSMVNAVKIYAWTHDGKV